MKNVIDMAESVGSYMERHIVVREKNCSKNELNKGNNQSIEIVVII